MATREDAEAGWERYREAGYALSLDEINSSLLAAGRSPIAPRTYNHYKKLRKYGYESYLPINQLDVKTLADPIWDQATRSRFLPMSIQEQVEVRFLSDDTVSELTGLATELSEGETTVKLKVGAEALPRTLASKEPIVEVVFRNGGEIRIGTVSRFWVEGKQELVVLKVQFSDPANIEAITNKPSAKRIRVRVQLGNPQDVRQFRELMQTLYWLFQTLESSRSFANEVLLTIDREPAVIIPAPQISTMSIRSPLTMEIILAAPILGMFTILVGQVLEWRNKWHEGTQKKFEGKVSKETALRLEWERHQREAGQSLDIEDLVAALLEAMSDELKDKALVDLSTRIDRLETIVNKQLGPAILRLAEETDGTIIIEPEADSA